MSKPAVLLQLDADAQASVFDAVVAADCDVAHLLRHAGVTPDLVRPLVHGAIFTRGPKDLHRTAIFIGGSDVSQGEALLAEVRAAFFGPLRVSVLLDANGANTTAAAAVVCLARQLDLSDSEIVVLAGTGSVGQRAARLLARGGATVRLGSRSLERATAVCDVISQQLPHAHLLPFASDTETAVVAAVAQADGLIAAGAAGVQLAPQPLLEQAGQLKVAVDLNAVPPLGVPGIEVGDVAAERSGVACYGAIGVGGLKMKIHKAAIRRLFESNDQVLDAEEVLQLASELELAAG